MLKHSKLTVSLVGFTITGSRRGPWNVKGIVRLFPNLEPMHNNQWNMFLWPFWIRKWKNFLKMLSGLDFIQLWIFVWNIERKYDTRLIFRTVFHHLCHRGSTIVGAAIKIGNIVVKNLLFPIKCLKNGVPRLVFWSEYDI